MNRSSIIIVVTVAAISAFGIGAIVQKDRSGTSSSSATLETGTQSQPVSAQGVLIRSHSPVIGEESAGVTIVEFFDPSCESCRAFFPTVEGILEKYPKDVKVVLRYAPFHAGSDEAVAILEAARRQNILMPVLTVLLERQPEWAIHGAPNLDLAWRLAGQVGLDLEKGKQDAKDPAIAELLKQDMADISANGVRGTPTFFINGNRLTSFGHQQLIDAVDAEVELQKNIE